MDAKQDFRHDAEHGRFADRPSEIPPKGLWDVIWRVYNEIVNDRVTLIAAGATYYIVLSLFPGMGVLVSIYGLLSDPSDIPLQISAFRDVLPPGAVDLLLPQLEALASKGRSALSFAFAASLVVALWSATSGVKALFEAMNVAYGENEKRGFLHLNGLAIAFTFGAVAVLLLLVTIIGIVPTILKLLYLDHWTELLARIIRWPFVLLLTGAATLAIYRFGPSREDARLRWLTWGAFISTITWAAATTAFSVYLLNFANYDATYGALGALIAFMIWIWISIVILIVGAEINAELEHQTMKDSTTGPPRPLGERGAVMADTVGPAAP